MQGKRRLFLQAGMAAGSFAAAVGAGLIPRDVLAAWPKAAFEATKLEETLKAIGATGAAENAAIQIKAPEIAENGAVVPIEVSTDMPNVKSISILAVNNPSPLAARFELSDASEPMVSTRIKMGKTSDIVAVVDTGNGIYTASREIKVTIGGCGG